MVDGPLKTHPGAKQHLERPEGIDEVAFLFHGGHW